MTPEVAQRVGRLERVVVELAAVVDAAHPRAHQEVLVGQDLVPERLDLGHLGEEPVAADVEAPALALGGTADATDHGVALDDGDRHVALHQLERGGEPGRSGSDHDYLRLVGHDSTTTFPFRPAPQVPRPLPDGPRATPRPTREDLPSGTSVARPALPGEPQTVAS